MSDIVELLRAAADRPAGILMAADLMKRAADEIEPLLEIERGYENLHTQLCQANEENAVLRERFADLERIYQSAIATWGT